MRLGSRKENRKGITPIVSVILLLLVTISIVGFAMLFFQRTAQSAGEAGQQQLQQQIATTAESFEIVNVDKNKVYVKNTGTATLSSLNFYVDGSEVPATASPIAPNAVGEIVLDSAKLAQMPGDKVRVTSVGYAQEQKSDFYAKNTVAYWRFDEADRDKIKDYSGNGNDGTFAGESWNDGTLIDDTLGNADGNTPPQLTSGKYGKSLNFDGTDDAVTAEDSTSLDSTRDAFTATAWIKDIDSDDGTDDDRNIISKGDTGTTASNTFRLKITNEKQVQLTIGSGGAHQDVTGSTVLKQDRWYHVAGVFDGSKIVVYVNGIQDANPVSKTIGALFDSGRLAIGRQSPEDCVPIHNSCWKGAIDEVRIYNRALSQQEIQEDMNSAYPIDRTVASYSFEKTDSFYAVGDPLVYSDDPETAITDDVDNGYKLMKTFKVPKSGSARIKFSAYISSGAKYWGWKIAKNGGTVLKQTSGSDAVGSYENNLDSGETNSVHSYRRFKVDVRGLVAGDLLELWMCSTNGGAACGPTANQVLFAKEFRIYADSPSKVLDTHNVVKGKYGAALSFDGNNVNAGNILNFAPTSPIAVSLWAFRTGSNSAMHILGKRSGCGSGGTNYQLVTPPLSFGGDPCVGGNPCSINTGIDLPMKTWTHLTASFDGAKFRFYINGDVVGQPVDGSLGPPNTADFLFGNSGSCPAGQSFQGLLDEIRILNAATS